MKNILTKHSVTIRSMRLSDYQEAFSLWQATTGIHLGSGHSAELIKNFLIRNPNLSRVAFTDDQLIGTALCGHDGLTGFIHHLAVSSACKQIGIGTALVNECLKALSELLIEKCQIIVSNDNIVGRIFWEKIGWKTVTDRQVMHWGPSPQINSTSFVLYREEKPF